MFHIFDGKETLEQWDQGRLLANECMKAGDCARFVSASGQTVLTHAFDNGGVAVVEVPNAILMNPVGIIVYRGKVGDDCRTFFEILKKDKPENYVFIDNVRGADVVPDVVGGDSNVFIAEYGKTTYAEVQSALDSGKACFAKHLRGTLYVMSRRGNHEGSYVVFVNIQVTYQNYNNAYGYYADALILSEDDKWTTDGRNLIFNEDLVRDVMEDNGSTSPPTTKAVFDFVNSSLAAVGGVVLIDNLDGTAMSSVENCFETISGNPMSTINARYSLLNPENFTVTALSVTGLEFDMNNTDEMVILSITAEGTRILEDTNTLERVKIIHRNDDSITVETKHYSLTSKS